MRGIDCALTGRLARDAEARQTKAGKPMTVLNLAVDEGGDEDAPPTWVRALTFEATADACAALKKGVAVYVEGRLRAEAYTPRDGGEPRVGLTVLARLAQPLGQIGRRRPPRAGATTAPVTHVRPDPGRPPWCQPSRRHDGDDGLDWERGDPIPFG